ncbi:MAG: YicC/YloC family endoribonuclease [Desulfobacterales bacterium]
MIKSMTAFARSEAGDDLRSVVIEVRSYNSRHLDLVMRLPAAYAGLEDKIKGLVAATVDRGRVELRLQMEAKAGETAAFKVNAPRAAACYRALSELRQLVDIDAPVALEHLIALGDMITPAEVDNDMASFWPFIQEGLGRALSELDTMRRREGGFIAADIGRRIDEIELVLKQIEASASGLLEKYRDRLRERITALTDGLMTVDGDRIMQEAAILAERSDITEEIVRAASHLAQFRDLMQAKEPAGRKLNFLMQELNREVNTVGSKTDQSAIAHMVVGVKAELEKIREQVQNVE